MMARKDEVDDLRGAKNALRAFVQAFRYAAQLDSKLDAAMAVEQRLTQWEREEREITQQIDGHRRELAGIKQAIAEARGMNDQVRAQVEATQRQLAEADAAMADKIRAQDAALEEERKAHEEAMAGFADQRRVAEADLAQLRADAQKIRDHFAGAPA